MNKLFNINSKFIVLLVFLLLILILIVLTGQRSKIPIVTTTSPKNNSTGIIETSQIEISFQKIPNDKEKELITIVADPNFEYDSTWNLNVYKIIPKSKLENYKKYKINVFYKEVEIYVFSFETEIFSLEQINKYGEIQTRLDLQYGEAVKEIVEKYPWYPKLPIRTTNYVIYYDFDQDKFVITFLIKDLDKKTEDSLIEDALSKIKILEPKDPIEYYINK